jgi:hypothetical protein
MQERRNGLRKAWHKMVSKVRGYDSDNAALFLGRPAVLRREGVILPALIYGNGGYNDEVVPGTVDLSESLSNPLMIRSVDASKNSLKAVGTPTSGFQKIDAVLEGNKVTLYQAVTAN